MDSEDYHCCECKHGKLIDLCKQCDAEIEAAYQARLLAKAKAIADKKEQEAIKHKLELMEQMDRLRSENPCSHCRGSGIKLDEDCDRCNGTGVEPDIERE